MADLTAELTFGHARRLGQREFCDLLHALKSLPELLLDGYTLGEDDSTTWDTAAAATMVQSSLRQAFASPHDEQHALGFCEALGHYLALSVCGLGCYPLAPERVRDQLRRSTGAEHIQVQEVAHG